MGSGTKKMKPHAISNLIFDFPFERYLQMFNYRDLKEGCGRVEDQRGTILPHPTPQNSLYFWADFLYIFV